MEMQDEQKLVKVQAGGGADAVYGIGMFGAWVYYFTRASTPEQRVKAFLKGLVWPAFLVYELFVFLEAASRPAPPPPPEPQPRPVKRQRRSSPAKKPAAA